LNDLFLLEGRSTSFITISYSILFRSAPGSAEGKREAGKQEGGTQKTKGGARARTEGRTDCVFAKSASGRCMPINIYACRSAFFPGRAFKLAKCSENQRAAVVVCRFCQSIFTRATLLLFLGCV
jgi:hypothetical protein